MNELDWWNEFEDIKKLEELLTSSSLMNFWIKSEISFKNEMQKSDFWIIVTKFMEFINLFKWYNVNFLEINISKNNNWIILVKEKELPIKKPISDSLEKWKQSIEVLLNTQEEINYIYEQIDYLKWIRLTIIEVIVELSKYKYEMFIVLNKDKVSQINDFIHSYIKVDVLWKISKNRYINIFYYLFEEIKNNKYSSLKEFEKTKGLIDTVDSPFYVFLKEEICSYIDMEIKILEKEKDSF